MTPKKPVIGSDGGEIHKDDEIIWHDKKNDISYEGIAADTFRRSNTLLFHEKDNKLELRVDAYDCRLK